jgi:flavin-dependent dehydrogenase
MKKYPNYSIEMATELVSLEQFDDRVQVKLNKRNAENSVVKEELSTYEWVVGADGARGVVRKLLGLSFLGETKAERFVVGDMKIEGLINVCFLLFWLFLLNGQPYRGGICGETWEILCELLPCQKLNIVLKI